MNTEFTVTLPEGHDTMNGLHILEKRYIEHVYKLSRYNQSKASKMLGISRGALRYKLKEYFGDKYINF
jgi:DNA-binding protein Fis